MKTINWKTHKSCFTHAFFEKLKSERETQLVEKWQNKVVLNDCGCWRQEDIAVVLENQEIACSLYNLPSQVALAKQLLRNLIAPYIVSVEAMQNYAELPFYARIRENYETKEKCIVFESEDIIAMHHKLRLEDKIEECDRVEEDTIWQETISAIKIDNLIDKMSLDLNQMVLSDLWNNAKYIAEAKGWRISDSIKMVKNSLSAIPGKIFSISSPKIAEWLTDSRETFCISPFLSKHENYMDITNYSSVIMPENRILLGVKGDEGYQGYGFRPFMMVGPSDSEDELLTVVGNKLFRGGSNYYGKVTINV